MLIEEKLVSRGLVRQYTSMYVFLLILLLFRRQVFRKKGLEILYGKTLKTLDAFIYIKIIL